MIVWLKNIVNDVVLSIGKIEWKPKNLLSIDEQADIKKLLVNNYYIILSRRNNALSTYFVMIANFFVMGKFGYWDHALMNAEDEVFDDNFMFVQATNIGVAYTDFDNVFNVNGTCLLSPTNMSIERWTAVLDRLKSDVGKPYDTLFNLTQDQELSCVELVRNALMADDDYLENFAHFEALCQKYQRLTPEMFYGCPDFRVVYEVRRK